MPPSKPESQKPAPIIPSAPATAPGGDAAPPSPPEPALHFCPTCGAVVVAYAGQNAHKAGTAWCDAHGRVML